MIFLSQTCRGLHSEGTCIGADLQPLDTENLFLFNEGSFNGLQAYKNSKAANIMFAYELARKLSGSGVKVNAVCPGKVIVQLLLSFFATWLVFRTVLLHPYNNNIYLSSCCYCSIVVIYTSSSCDPYELSAHRRHMHDESPVASPTGSVPTCWSHALTPRTSPEYRPATLLLVSLWDVVPSMMPNLTVFISLSSDIVVSLLKEVCCVKVCLLWPRRHISVTTLQLFLCSKSFHE